MKLLFTRRGEAHEELLLFSNPILIILLQSIAEK